MAHPDKIVKTSLTRIAPVDDWRLSMYDDFGIGATEVIVFLTIGATLWALFALATATRCRPGICERRRP